MFQEYVEEEETDEEDLIPVKRSREKREATPEPEPEEDTTLYCLCKTLYDANRFMIECDKCKNWFHDS